MPGPFHGMDPYLEHPVLWPSLQQYFVTHLADTLTEVLPRRYLARIGERVYLDGGDADLAEGNAGPPKVCALPTAPRPNHRPADDLAAGVSPPWHIPTLPEETRESYLEVVPVTEPGRVLTVIEFPGFANKTVGSLGRRLYRTARQDRLAAGAAVLEIDLLRAGCHTVLAPRERVLRRGRYDYLACLCRAGRRDFCEVWGIPLRDRLPRVALPLDPADPDLVVDLQTVFDASYDAGNFARRAEYDRDPFVPLPRPDAAWADLILRDR